MVWSGQVLTLIAVVVVCIAILVGNIEWARAVFRRGAMERQRDRAAVNFALTNFARLRDLRQPELITRDSLLMSKMGFSRAEQEHVDRLVQRIEAFGHVIHTDKSGPLPRYTFGMSQDDLKRALVNIG